MKVCKKCKKKVANKSKICKYCGADVSKAKIIKTAPKNNKKPATNKPTNTKTNTKKQQKPIASTNSKQQKPIVVTKEQNTKKVNNVRNRYNNKERALNTSEGIKKAIKYVILDILNGLKNSVVITFQSIISIFKSTYKVSNSSAKAINNKRKQNKEKRIEKKNEKEKLKELQSPVLEVAEEIEEDEFTRPKKVRSKRYKRIRLAFVLSFIAVLCGAGYCGYRYIYRDVIGETTKVVIGEKATTDKIFSMNDVITYNDVDYKIVKVETSKGNNYKSPKAGHQFLIVTVYIKNNSSEKVSYSYENWTMSNSKGEEKKRIFTAINVDTALYSGELVVGGIKTGSMVFEQPVNDKKLKMNYYELKKDKDGNETADQSKRVFSISVKLPGKEKKQDTEEKKEDSKIIKNS